MARPSRSRALQVWSNGLRVGTWTIPSGAPMAFSYDPAWVDAEEGRPLSLSLPINLDGLTLKGDRVGNYFDNLLPDSEPIRRRIQTKFIGSPRFVVGISTPRPMPAASVGT